MEIIKENLKRCDAFYKSDFFDFLKENNPDFIPGVFTEMCDDPDACDIVLYEDLGAKFSLPVRKYYLLDTVEGNDIRLAADVVCGRRQIAKFHKESYLYWRDDYEKVRSNLNLHFLWPKHKAPTINTYRYTIYLDRIDCLLFDLKCYFEGQLTPMCPAYEREKTAIWLNQFHNDFSFFIDKMKLTAFVDEEYNVLDISQGQRIILTEILNRKEVMRTLDDYMKNLLYLNKQGKFS